MSEWKIACACGWEVEGDQQEVLAATKDHGRTIHNMDVTDEQAMAMAVPLRD